MCGIQDIETSRRQCAAVRMNGLRKFLEQEIEQRKKRHQALVEARNPLAFCAAAWAGCPKVPFLSRIS